MNKLEIKSLLSNYPYNEYRNYRIISQEKREEFLYKRILDLQKREGIWIIEEKREGEIVGLIILERLDWDSKFFGIEMGVIEYIITKRDLNYEEGLRVKDKLIKEVLEVAKENRIKHITSKVDCSDHTSIYVLQRNGFYLMDTILTYIFTQKNKIPHLKELYKVREAKEEDLPILMEIARQSFRNSRFHRDPCLPKEKADELYVEWIKNAYYKKMAEFVLVAEKSQKPIGFFTCKLNTDLLNYVQIRCLGRGLAAVLLESKGAYIGLMERTLDRGMNIMGVDIGEFDTQIYNYPVIKAYQRFGMELVKARYILHKFLK